jgi:hypothetical protein
LVKPLRRDRQAEGSFFWISAFGALGSGALSGALGAGAGATPGATGAGAPPPQPQPQEEAASQQVTFLQQHLQANRLFTRSARGRRQQHGFSQQAFSQQAGLQQQAFSQQAGLQQRGFSQQHGFSQQNSLRQHGFSQQAFSQQAGFAQHAFSQQHGLWQPSSLLQHGFSQQAFSQQAGFAQQAGSGAQHFAGPQVSHLQHRRDSSRSFSPQNKSRTGVAQGSQQVFWPQAFSQQAGSGAQHFVAGSQQATLQA